MKRIRVQPPGTKSQELGAQDPKISLYSTGHEKEKQGVYTKKNTQGVFTKALPHRTTSLWRQRGLMVLHDAVRKQRDPEG